MASHQTTNFQLCQWEADDEVLRTDFNADNLKIENALSAIKTVADVAYTPENRPYVVGTYTGDGAKQRVISLGFTPSAVLVMMRNGDLNNHSGSYYGGLALPGANASTSAEGATRWIDAQTIVAIVEGGFQVGQHKNGPTVASNGANNVFYYVALR